MGAGSKTASHGDFMDNRQSLPAGAPETMSSIYSPNQVLAAAFLGGPFAAIYALKQNFDALGVPFASQMVIRWGVAAVVILLSVIPFLPQNFPQIIIPLVYSFTARSISLQFQMTREQIAESTEHDFVPLSRLIMHSLLAMLVFMLVAAVWLGTLDSYGIIDLPEPPQAPSPKP